MSKERNPKGAGNKLAPKHNERKAGRTPLPPELKKHPVTVFLKQGEIDKLTEAYGSVPLGVAYLLTL